MVHVSEDLLNQGYMPLFHKHLDRFDDLFSAGILFDDETENAEIELVGKGFDAADLRLGRAVPHESIRLNLTTGRLERLSLISRETYARQRSERVAYAQALEAYTNFANRSGRLLPSVNDLPTAPPSTKQESRVPLSYHQIPQQSLEELAKISKTVRSLLSALPTSKTYVASLSYLGNEGWILWDIYGQWYLR